MIWNQAEAVAMCVAIEAVCPRYGCHVALTGGCLYKDGARKDCDIVFYRIRQEPVIQMDNLWAALAGIGFVKEKGGGWIFKARYMGKPVDCFFPEEAAPGEYERADPNDKPIPAHLLRNPFNDFNPSDEIF